jgi:hypothetical protein
LRQSLANAARDKVTTHFDLAKNVRQLGGLLQKFQQNA